MFFIYFFNYVLDYGGMFMAFRERRRLKAPLFKIEVLSITRVSSLAP